MVSACEKGGVGWKRRPPEGIERAAMLPLQDAPAPARVTRPASCTVASHGDEARHVRIHDRGSGVCPAVPRCRGTADVLRSAAAQDDREVARAGPGLLRVNAEGRAGEPDTRDARDGTRPGPAGQ